MANRANAPMFTVAGDERVNKSPRFFCHHGQHVVQNPTDGTHALIPQRVIGWQEIVRSWSFGSGRPPGKSEAHGSAARVSHYQSRIFRLCSKT